MKSFSPKDRVTVNDPASPDNGKQGTVQAYDADGEECAVRLDGDSADKLFKCDKLKAAPPKP